jgi:hypothetical protein
MAAAPSPQPTRPRTRHGHFGSAPEFCRDGPLTLDLLGDIQLTNRAVGVLLDGVDSALLRPPINAYRLSLHPAGLATRIRNRSEWVAHLGHRLTRVARLTGEHRLAELLMEVRSYPGVADALDNYHEPVAAELLLTLQLAHPGGDLRFHSAVTSFGSAHDITLAELTIESFVPADAHTREFMQHLELPPQ